VLLKDWRFGKPDALKRYQELADSLSAKVDHLNDIISIQATKIEAQTAKLEAQAAKIEAQAAKIEAQAAKIEAQALVIADLTNVVKDQGRELEDFRNGVIILINQIRDLNAEPNWMPRGKRA
jgi:soluble cytochrome b562